MAKTMAVVMDYQNVHLTAAELYLPGRPAGEALIEPFKFAAQLAQAKNASQSDAAKHVEVRRVEVYRGIPIQEDDFDANRRNQEQKSRWEHGHIGIVSVTLRPLMYRDWRWVNGVRVPVRPSRREKGVDVLCALALTRLAQSGMYDVVVLASRDTDLAPALDEAARLGRAKVEAVKWYKPDDRQTFGSIRTERRLWTTSMDEQRFRASLDTFDNR
jgi:uncharacterized LabA/DUF88 family protein